ncbi:MAG: DinB family protein [Deferribacteres bacterium]|nr:DinB family protein [candidate division KSB1 bacterium]MCB9510998.1 DinB family protein [Deferribacteres bacterium]
MIEHMLDTWEIHNRIHLYLLESLEDENLSDVAASKGRSVGQQFAHIHNVRLMWIDAAQKELGEGLSKLAKETPLSKEMLAQHLIDSGQAIKELLAVGFEGGRIKGFKPHPTAFLGYLISHESHHRGQIMLALKQSGHAASRKIAFGMWEWGVR